MFRRHRRVRARHRLRSVPLDRPTEQPWAKPIVDKWADATQHLEDLRIALSVTDPTLFARLIRPQNGPPLLNVHNPAGAGRFAEDVRVRHASTPDDLDYFMWSWGEEITPVTTPEIAAQRIRTVLAVRRSQS